MFESFKKYVSTSLDGKMQHLYVDYPVRVLIEKFKRYFQKNEYQNIKLDYDFGEVYGRDNELTEVTITVIQDGAKSKIAIQCYNDFGIFKPWNKLKFLHKNLNQIIQDY